MNTGWISVIFIVVVDRIIGRGIQNMLRKFFSEHETLLIVNKKKLFPKIPNYSKLKLLQTYLLQEFEIL